MEDRDGLPVATGRTREPTANRERVKDLTGELVRFPSKEGLAWGIEISLPIDSRQRMLLKRSGIKIPEHINNIRFVELAPQESLPKKLRTIRSKKPRWRRSALEKLAGSKVPHLPPRIEKLLKKMKVNFPVYKTLESFATAMNFDLPIDKRSRDTLKGLFLSVVEKDQQDPFNKLLKSSKSKEILIVHGHGGGDPYIMGEQYGDSVFDAKGKAIQKKGNWVPVEEILEKYDNSNKFAVIMLTGCNVDGAKINALNVPLVYPVGKIPGTLKSTPFMRKVKTIFSYPKQEI